jgi:hypothetical protein
VSTKFYVIHNVCILRIVFYYLHFLGEVLSTKLLPVLQNAIVWEVRYCSLLHFGKIESCERWGQMLMLKQLALWNNGVCQGMLNTVQHSAPKKETMYCMKDS